MHFEKDPGLRFKRHKKIVKKRIGFKCWVGAGGARDNLTLARKGTRIGWWWWWFFLLMTEMVTLILSAHLPWFAAGPFCWFSPPPAPGPLTGRTKSGQKYPENWVQKLLANMWPLIFATLLQIVSSNEKNAIKAKMRRKSKPNIASTKHLLLEYWQQEQILLLALRWKSAHIGIPELILPFCFKVHNSSLDIVSYQLRAKVASFKLFGCLDFQPFCQLVSFLNEGFFGGWHRWCGQRSISGKFGTKFGFYTNLWQ